VLANATNAVERAITRSTIRVKAEVDRLLNLQSGPFKGNPTAVPSVPGEPPHKRWGTLGRSIEFETFRTADAFVGRVGTNLKYGLYLEIGTRTMRPRPYLRPAIDSQRSQIIADITKAGKEMGNGR